MLWSTASLLHRQRDRASQLQRSEAGRAARGAQGCPSERGPCTPGGCVPGQGLCRLPGSAPSLLKEFPTALQGEGVGGRSDPQHGRTGMSRAGQGKVFLLSGECCLCQGFSPLQLSLMTFQSGLLKKHINSVTTFPFLPHQVFCDLVFSPCTRRDAPGQCPAPGRCWQGRGERTASGMGFVSSDRELCWGQGDSSWQQRRGQGVRGSYCQKEWGGGVGGGRFSSCSDADPLGPAMQVCPWEQSAQVSCRQLQDIELCPWGVLRGCRVPSRRAQLSPRISVLPRIPMEKTPGC